LVALGLDAEGWTDSFFPHPTNATTAIIKRICFMTATLRHNGTGVNAVGGERQEKLLHQLGGSLWSSANQISG
jgi:hypothetical protein